MKTVVWKSDLRTSCVVPAVGLAFKSGEPRPVTDEQAAILLAIDQNPYLQGSQQEIDRLIAVAAERASVFVPTPNPNYGKPINPDFTEYKADAPPAAAPAPAPDIQKPAAPAAQ